MANFITTLPKLTGPADYSFWKVHVKLTLALIICLRAVFTTDDMLNALALPQTTNVDEIVKRNFLGS